MAASGSDLASSDILKMVSSLPERQASIVNAIFVEGQRAADVAARLNMSEGAVRVALHRALKTLAATFGSGSGTGADDAHG
jgi:RNA polymerase sigma-70 factor (ECF subfamily)